MGEWERIDREGYGPLAEIYHRTRPSCPAELVERLARHAGVGVGDPVAEIGAGTGLLTGLLAGRGLSVTALEPVPEMRSQAPPLPGVTWTDGTFECTGLPDASQRWVVSAQAFQWAQREAALPEMRRILSPAGWFTALWYAYEISRAEVLQRTFTLLREHIPEYRYLDRTTRGRRWSSRLLSALPEAAQLGLGRIASLVSARGGRGTQLQSTAAFGKVVYHEARLGTLVDRDGYLDLWRSRNRLRSLGKDGAFEAFLAALAEDLARHRVDHLDVPYVFGAWSARARR